MKKALSIVCDLSTDIFVASLLVFAILLLGESIKQGFVDYFFNLGTISLCVFFIGVLSILTSITPPNDED